MRYLITLEVEPKDGGPAESELPTAQSLVGRLNDVLNDVTKHDETIGWRVTRVRRFATTDLVV